MTVSSAPVRTGPLREVLRTLEPGDVAVIDVDDLDREAARRLVAAGAAAVLNAGSSMTGRVLVGGARVLAEAGVMHVDELGPEILALRDGQLVRIEDGVVWQGDEDVAEGEMVTAARIEEATRAARAALPAHLESLDGERREALTEHPLLLDREGLPELGFDRTRPILVLGPDADLTPIRTWMREEHPYVVAVDSPVTADVHIGRLDGIPDEVLRAARHLVLHSPDGAPATREFGRDLETITSSLPTPAVALLLACAATDAPVVTAGLPTGFEDALDAGLTPALDLVRMRHGDRIVSADAVAHLQRPGIRTWQLLTLGVVALLAILLALLTTPVGQAALGLGPDWLANLFGAGSNESLAPLVPKEELWSVSATTSSL